MQIVTSYLQILTYILAQNEALRTGITTHYELIA